VFRAYRTIFGVQGLKVHYYPLRVKGSEIEFRVSNLGLRVES
jgi:hypothetical protein